MKEGTEGSKSPLPVEQRIAESEAAASAAKAELDAAEAELKAFKAREDAAAVPTTAQAAPTDDLPLTTPPLESDGRDTPEHEYTDAPEGVVHGPKTFTDAHPYLTQAMPSLAEIRGEIEAVIGAIPEGEATAQTQADLPPPQHNDADTGGTAAPSPDIEPSICPASIGTAACITTVIIGVVAITAASM